VGATSVASRNIDAWIVLVDAIPASSVEHFLAASRQIPDPPTRASALVAATRRTSDEAQKHVVADLIDALKEAPEWQALAGLPADLPGETVATLIRAMDELTTPKTRLLAVGALARWLDARTLDQSAAAALASARSDEWPLTRLSVIRTVAEFLPAARYREALDIARSLDDELRAAAIAKLLRHSPEEDRESLVEEVLRSIEAVVELNPDSWYISDAVTDVAALAQPSRLSRLVTILGKLESRTPPLSAVVASIGVAAGAEQRELVSQLLRALATRERGTLLAVIPELGPLFRTLSGSDWAIDIVREIDEAVAGWP
jgi:hypothetical protein